MNSFEIRMTFYLKSKNRIFFSLLKHAITPAKLSVAVHLHIMQNANAHKTLSKVELFAKIVNDVNYFRLNPHLKSIKGFSKMGFVVATKGLKFHDLVFSNPIFQRILLIFNFGLSAQSL